MTTTSKRPRKELISAKRAILAQHGPELGWAIIRAMLHRNGPVVRALVSLSARQQAWPQDAA